ncbi:hypothetical protein GTZ99_01620 [Novosphingobium sp. FSY-8]|uniref:Uncharacterized protein n=1 Tax=Novosphingobium ovatum TaxID=1908523 RepID=A0ABW9X9S3_9SPHN|nr:hypothetical protein [Novosphingobium ovatum]NBC35252.1 hypothetical protein [Novosphingobium ovatum]
MQTFSTSFPIKQQKNRAAFPAQIVAWLRGIPNSTVLTLNAEHELESENAHLVADSGEELRIRELVQEGRPIAIGFQHNMPDNKGRIWRTEAVLCYGEKNDFIGLTTQCLAGQHGAFLEQPKKPYLIKSILKAEWGDFDGEIEVMDEPLWLKENNDDLNFAQLVQNGKASAHLPVVYVSSTGKNEWILDKDEIEKIAYDLGGIAHIVVEPSRNFSFSLKELCNGNNVYNGTIGIFIPGIGFVRRFFIGHQFENVQILIDGICESARRLISSTPSPAWSWSDLQEQALRNQRDSLKDAISQEDANDLLEQYTDELKSAQDEIRRLKMELSDQSLRNIQVEDNHVIRENDLSSYCQEIYDGEVKDRLRLAAQIAQNNVESLGIDARTVAVWKKFVESSSRSYGLNELTENLKAATRDGKNLADRVAYLLIRHGYHNKSDNKHVRLEPNSGYDGLQSITLPKTPSDHRTSKNQYAQISKTLGLRNLLAD